MAKYGVRVPPGIACHTPDEVAAAAAKLSGESGEVVVKSQVRTHPHPFVEFETNLSHVFLRHHHDGVGATRARLSKKRAASF
jgi:hypothetical protein